MGKILVTGATGFTGSHLCQRLAQAGDDVVAFVRPGSPTDLLESWGVECRCVDIRDIQAVASSFRGIRSIYHLASAYRKEPADRRIFDQVNVEGTRNLLEVATNSGVERFLHCSTVGVHGAIDSPPATEESPLRPRDHYQRTKLQGELLARSYGERGLPVTVVRPVGIYGPGDRRFLKLFRALARGHFAMIGSGKTLYHLTYIDDLVEGLLLAGSRPRAENEVFILAGPRYTTLAELVRLIAKAVGGDPPRLRLPYSLAWVAAILCEGIWRRLGLSPPLYRRRIEFFAAHRAFDISKARRLLGYSPRVEPEEGVPRTAAWYRASDLL